MRKLRRITLVVAASTLALTGCGGGSDDDTDEAKASGGGNEEAVCKTADGDGPKIGVAYDVGGRGDQSFNDAAYTGLEKAVDELDATCVEAEAGTGETDTIRGDRLRTLAEQGFNPIIAVGYIYSPAAAEVAAEFPDTNFAVIDGFASSVAPSDNLADLTFADNEGSYLVGVAAALKSEAKHVGFIGGTPGDLIKGFEAGYVAGVKAVDPQMKVEVQYLTQDPDDGEGGFENSPGARTAAEGMLDKGVDVIYHAAGKSGLGLFQAVAGQDGKWAIGVDSDQYLTASDDQKPHILTSMLKRIDTGVFDFAQAVANDEVPNGFVKYDLAKEGVGFSTSGGFVDDIAEQINGYGEKISNGEIKVPTAP